jgi:hypothetical protein
MAKKPETLFKEDVHKDLKALQKQQHLVWFEKVQQVAIRGTPDEWLCVGGFAVAMELKSGDEKPDLHQQFKLERFHAAGGIALPCVTRENWQEILKIITELSHPERSFESRVLVRQRLRLLGLAQFASLPSLLCSETQESVSHRLLKRQLKQKKAPR